MNGCVADQCRHVELCVDFVVDLVGDSEVFLGMVSAVCSSSVVATWLV